MSQNVVQAGWDSQKKMTLRVDNATLLSGQIRPAFILSKSPVIQQMRVTQIHRYQYENQSNFLMAATSLFMPASCLVSWWSLHQVVTETSG